MVLSGQRIDPALAQWLRARARLLPGALDEVTGVAREIYEHEWAPVQLLGRWLSFLPAQLWETLLQWEGGYALLWAGESSYEPGEVEFRGRLLCGVARISLAECAGWAPNRVLHVFGHLVDHHLGCGGEAEGAWLSEGGGLTDAWREAGQQLQRLFALGYGYDEVAQSGVRDYFAQSLAAYCRERRALSVADPQVVRWFRTTLWSVRFWK